jgi:hypothetical protein
MLRILVAVILHHKQIAGATSVFLQRLTEKLTILSRPGDFFKILPVHPRRNQHFASRGLESGLGKNCDFC